MMNKLNTCCLALILATAGGCGSFTPKQVPESRAGAEAASIPRTPDAKQPADLDALKDHLNFQRDEKDLGFTEKSFNSCQIPYKNDEGKCGARYLTVVNFRLRCRDTEDTVSTVPDVLTPVVTDEMRWKLGATSGLTKTSRKGYGQITMVSATSNRGQRLVLIVGKQFLGLEISQVSQIVVPVYWCDGR